MGLFWVLLAQETEGNSHLNSVLDLTFLSHHITDKQEVRISRPAWRAPHREGRQFNFLFSKHTSLLHRSGRGQEPGSTKGSPSTSCP